MLDRLLHRILIGFGLAIVICGTTVLPRIAEINPILIGLGILIGIALHLACVSYMKTRISGNQFHDTSSRMSRNVPLVLTLVAIVTMGVFSGGLGAYHRYFDYVGIPISVGLLVGVGGLLGWLMRFEAQRGKVYCARHD
jgi:cytochrome bd-type quinol oxidase subunit 2